MISSKWLLHTISLIAVLNTSTVALQRDVEPRRCYLCNNESTCEPQQGSWPSASCSTQRPYCATIAGSPNFTSFLTCAATVDTPCSLTYTKKNQKYEMNCACPNHLCNAPFSQQLQNELIIFSTSNTPRNDSIDYSDIFWQYSHFNVTENIYKMITGRTVPEMVTFTGVSSLGTMGVDDTPQYLEDLTTGPRAAPLKLEMTTMPSDDDDEEGEGSGADDAERALNSPQEPAAPSSYLPASENSAAYIFTNILAPALMLLYITL